MFEHPDKIKANRYAIGYVLVTLAVLAIMALASCAPLELAGGFVAGASPNCSAVDDSFWCKFR